MTQDPFYEPDSQSYQAAPIEEKPAKNKTTIIIIVVTVVLLLCCCCVIAAWFLGDPIIKIINDVMYEMGMNLTTFAIG